MHGNVALRLSRCKACWHASARTLKTPGTPRMCALVCGHLQRPECVALCPGRRIPPQKVCALHNLLLIIAAVRFLLCCADATAQKRQEQSWGLRSAGKWGAMSGHCISWCMLAVQARRRTPMVFTDS